MAVCAVTASGCYSLVRVPSGSPAPGVRVALEVNDAGRAALGGSIGPEVDRIEGTLIERDNGEYLLGVSSVSLLRGGVQTWKGEKVVVKPEFVSNVYERKFDALRTGVTAAVLAGAVTYIATQGLIGAGQDDEAKPPVDTGTTRRSPPRHKVTLFSIPLSKIPFLGRP